jgi:hypothetical protein
MGKIILQMQAGRHIFRGIMEEEEGEALLFLCLAQVGEYQFSISYWHVKIELVKQHGKFEHWD